MAKVTNLVESPVFAGSNASGYLSFLEEDSDDLKIVALKKIHLIVDSCWAEVCDSLALLESLSEDPTFGGADLAASIASKCFFHLQEYNDSLRHALNAGLYFNISEKNEYVDTLLGKCIDEYKELRNQQETTSDPLNRPKIDSKMEDIIEQMFIRCYRDQCFEQAMGVALDTRRIDKVRETLLIAIENEKYTVLGSTFALCQSRSIPSKRFRLEVIDVLVGLYRTLPNPDYANVCYGLQYLDRPAEVASILSDLCRGDDQSLLMGLQIAFDLQETENQGFVLKVVQALPLPPSTTPFDSSFEPEATSLLSPQEEPFSANLSKLRQILTQSLDIDLQLNFLFKQSKLDINTLQIIKTAIEGKPNILHNATIIAHSFLNCGTTQDTFLRNDLAWMGKASNWAKFTAVGSLGVVHKGHIHESMSLMQPYLPAPGSVDSSSPYSESGAFYALGLIHANKGGAGDAKIVSFLRDKLVELKERGGAGNSEILIHGAALGVGLSAMATGDEVIFNILHDILMQDNAVAGEGAALAIGLLMVGQFDENWADRVTELLTFAHDSKHEKITRAVALSIAMMLYGKEESADVMIEQMTRDRDPIIRYGGVFGIGLAYCGSSDNASIRKLLHTAVSDVNDDVRRAAVMCLGFLNFRSPEAVPPLVSLLAESFNPHVRYGACLAVGLSCAGTALKEAIDLLTPLMEDSIDFVRQGAQMSLAMVLMQVAEARSPSVKKLREDLISTIQDKHQPVMSKSGAIIASGILDAGGKNSSLNFQSRGGFMRMGGVVGLTMFLQYWFWYPLHLFLGLSFAPTALIGLNKDFDMPLSFEVTCNAPPSMFAYPKAEEKKEVKKVVATAVLSTTTKTKVRELRKEAKKQAEEGRRLGPPSLERTLSTAQALERVPSLTSQPSGLALDRVPSLLSQASDIYTTQVEGEDKTAKKPKEPSSFQLSNPSRLTPSQLRFISLASASSSVDQRYLPVSRDRRATPSGIVMLLDLNPSAESELVTKIERILPGQELEADPPQPFEWDPSIE